MVDLLVIANDSKYWNVSFFRVAHNCEMDSFVVFFDKLYAMLLGVKIEDKMK